MSLDLLLVCVTIYMLFGRYMRAKATVVEEQAHALQLSNDKDEYEY